VFEARALEGGLETAPHRLDFGKLGHALTFSTRTGRRL
jgi:hypothetical protein